MFGCPSGVEIARGLMARSWISAHDEDKDDRGVAVSKTVTRRMGVEEVMGALGEGEEGEWLRKKGWKCEARSLDVGEEMTIDAS